MSPIAGSAPRGTPDYPDPEGEGQLVDRSQILQDSENTAVVFG